MVPALSMTCPSRVTTTTRRESRHDQQPYLASVSSRQRQPTVPRRSSKRARYRAERRKRQSVIDIDAMRNRCTSKSSDFGFTRSRSNVDCAGSAFVRTAFKSLVNSSRTRERTIHVTRPNWFVRTKSTTRSAADVVSTTIYSPPATAAIATSASGSTVPRFHSRSTTPESLAQFQAALDAQCLLPLLCGGEDPGDHKMPVTRPLECSFFRVSLGT